MQAIVYQQNGNLVTVSPAPGWPIKFVAMKDVPAGVPYLLVDADTLDVSKLDFSKPDGVGHPDFGLGTDWGIAEYNDDGTITLVNATTKETKEFDPQITPA